MMQRSLTLLAPLLIALGLAACALPSNDGALFPTPEVHPVQQVTPERDVFTGTEGPRTFEFPTIWFVELDAPPTAAGGSISTLSAALGSVQTSAAQAGISYEPRYVFSTFVSGFSARMSPGDVLAIANLPGVKSVSPVDIVPAPQVERHAPGDLTPDMATARAMTGAEYVVDTLLFDGTGVKVGIIDTGILLSHPEFAGRIVAGFDFVGDFYNASDPLNDTPVPEPGPFTRTGGGDCNGHGTHVAGIVAAGGVIVSGVAPGAELGAYRVFGCDGSSNSDVILAAVERAFADGMDIVNLSLGSNNGWPQDFNSVALSRMMEFGMIPVASAGNNGANGVFTVGSPGAGANVLTVASFENTNLTSKVMEVGGEDIGYQVLTGAPIPPTTGTTPEIVYVGQGCNADAYLDNPNGLVALVTRGGCTFGEKYARAVANGAVAVIIENNSPGSFAGTLGGTPAPVEGVSISGNAGDFIRGLITASAAPTITWTDRILIEANPTANLISGFSSYGLAPDLSLKPDFGAPGGLIFSAMIDGASPGVAGSAGYAVLSGTSMAAPHVAGAAALLLEARPDIAPHRVRDALSNAANPQVWSLNPGLGFLDSVHRQGAGMIRIDDAILSRNHAVPAKLSMGEVGLGATYTDVISIHNATAQSVTYRLGTWIPSIGTAGNTYAPSFFLSVPTVQYFRLQGSSAFTPIDEVVVPAGGIASFQVRITAPADLANGAVFGTYLAFTPVVNVVGSLPIRVPVAGMAGDYQSLPNIDFGPELIVEFGGLLYLAPPGYAYSMIGEDVPLVAVGHSLAASNVKVEVVPLGANAWIGVQPGSEFDLVRRTNGTAVTVYGAWDFDMAYLPNGEYQFRITVLKALGDPTNPAHYEVHESPSFFIQRQ